MLIGLVGDLVMTFTGIRSNRWTSLSILNGRGNLYPVLQDTARPCRGILQIA